MLLQTLDYVHEQYIEHHYGEHQLESTPVCSHQNSAMNAVDTFHWQVYYKDFVPIATIQKK